MNTSRAKFSIANGMALMLITFLLMSCTKTSIQALKMLGFLVFISGLPAISVSGFLRPHPTDDWRIMLYICIYYFFIGSASGYLGHRFGNSLTKKMAISAGSTFFVAVFSLILAGIAFKLQQYES